MNGKWYTNLVQLKELDFSHNDIFIVKLVMIIKSDGNKYVTESKICPARLSKMDTCVEWEIDDGMGDFLHIKMPNDGFELGCTHFDSDDNTDDVSPDYIYVITACQLVKTQHNYKKYIINTGSSEKPTSTPLCHMENREEARNIVIALRHNHINAAVNKLAHPLKINE